MKKTVGIFSNIALNIDMEANNSEFVGSFIASRDFIKFIIRSKEIDVKIFADDDVENLNAKLDANINNNAKYFANKDIYESFDKNKDIIFHNPMGLNISAECSVRRNIVGEDFPITCVTHGLSDPKHIWDIYTRFFIDDIREYDAIICTSNAAKTAIHNIFQSIHEEMSYNGVKIQYPKVSTHVLPLGIDIDKYCKIEKRQACDILDLNPSDTHLLYFGRVDFQTKFDFIPLLTLIKRVAGVMKNKKIKLLIAGRMTSYDLMRIQSAALQLGCSDLLVLRSNPALFEAPIYFSASDIFLGLSDTLQETFGLTLLEAMASKLPVVACDWSGYRDIVDHGTTGFLIPTVWSECRSTHNLHDLFYSFPEYHFCYSQQIAFSIEEMAIKILELLNNDNLRNTMAENSRLKVERQYDWVGIISNYINLWKELQMIAATKTSTHNNKSFSVYKNFHHYASSNIQELGLITIDSQNLKLVFSNDKIICHPEIANYLNVDLLIYMKNYFVNKKTFHIDEIKSLIMNKYKISSEYADSHILWMIKYGVVKKQLTV